MVSVLSFCENEVKKNDYERYLCCLLVNNYLRHRLFPIYAFNNEISKVKHIISEPMAGYIRLQWWHDAIDEIYEREPIKHRHEIVDGLYELVCETEIPKTMFHDLIDAREEEVDFKVPSDLESLNEYVVKTSSNLFDLLLFAAGVNCKTAHEAAYHAGVSYAIVGIMRSIKYNAYYGRILFPEDLMKKEGITIEDIINGNNLDKAKNIVKALCDKAEVNLQHVKTLIKGTSNEAKSVLLPVCIVDVFLKRIRKHDFDIFNSDLEGNVFPVQFKILKSKILKTV
jgi:NADH dehydrogenase [ubiquinone] 1 alpha subcomplex assembly factor 6